MSVVVSPFNQPRGGFSPFNQPRGGVSPFNQPRGGPFTFGIGGPSVPQVPVPGPGPAPAPNADPAVTAKHKQEYARALEQQLKAGADKLAAEMKGQVDQLHDQASQEKTLHSLLVDQQVKQQELVLSQQYNQQLMLLTQAAQRQGAELEQQATSLMLDYQQRKVEEDFVASQAGVEKQFADMQMKFTDELQKSNIYPIPPGMQLGAGLPPPNLLGGSSRMPNGPGSAPPMLPGLSGLPNPMLQYKPPGAGVRGPSPGSFSAGGSSRAPTAPLLSFTPAPGQMFGQPGLPRPGNPGMMPMMGRR